MSKLKPREAKFIVTLLLLGLVIGVRFWVMGLTATNFELWSAVKDFWSVTTIMLSLVGIGLAIGRLFAANKSLAMKITLPICIILYFLVILESLFTIAVSGIGFMG